jgi:hypothetical protein
MMMIKSYVQWYAHVTGEIQTQTLNQGYQDCHIPDLLNTS